MAYKTIAMVVGSTRGQRAINIYLETSDERQRRLVLQLPVNSDHPTSRDIANARLAMLCRSVGVEQLTDTDDLNGLECLVEYRADGNIVAIRPVKVVEYRTLPRRTFWQWLFGREPGNETV